MLVLFQEALTAKMMTNGPNEILLEMTAVVFTCSFLRVSEFCLFSSRFLPEVVALDMSFMKNSCSQQCINVYSCRAISVILGDRWKKMKNEERRMYTLEAKALAEEQKRLNPDCWKRKRTNSVCFHK